MDGIYPIIYGAVGGGVTGLILTAGIGIFIWYFKRVMSERDKLSEARITSIKSDITNLQRV